MGPLLLAGEALGPAPAPLMSLQGPLARLPWSLGKEVRLALKVLPQPSKAVCSFREVPVNLFHNSNPGHSLQCVSSQCTTVIGVTALSLPL